MNYGSCFILLAIACFVAISRESPAQEIERTPATAIAPFDALQADAFQAAWADHLNVPVEFTNSINMRFAVIPPGEFKMGSPESEPGRLDNERYREVELEKPFLIGMTEVTQSQYESVIGKNPARFKGANHPVEKVSWEEAVEFCKKLSALPAEQAAGRVYRLPREDEWEFACRAGTTTAFSFGDDSSLADQYVWFKENSGGKTHAVAEKQPNAWGLFDMHGNVFEWCEIEPAGEHRFLTTDSKGLHESWGQVYRGGAWLNPADRCRSASRSIYKPTFHYHYIGFRVALDCPPAGQADQ